jgi:NAD+ diphosphatase
MKHRVNPPPHVYSGHGFDRAGLRRTDARWLAERRADPSTRVVALAEQLAVLIAGEEAAPRAGLVTVAELGRPLPEEALFLGIEAEVAVFAVELNDHRPAAGRFVDLRGVGPLLPRREAGLLAYARGLAYWHARHRFCGVCGAPTLSQQGGHQRRCSGCGAVHFPRTDPAVIVLVTHRERCLLGRSARFPAGMYSTLAGFVEPGESLEETVVREVFEEAGVRVGLPRYRSSQPWPFPASLMLGFRAEALTDDLSIDPDELVDARWLTRAQLRDEARRPVQLPRPDSIARSLIEDWLAEAE